MYLIDTSDGTLVAVDRDYSTLEASWRPPDGRQLMFIGGAWPYYGLRLVTVDTLDTGKRPEIARIPINGGTPIRPQEQETLRPIGWTPDGTRFVYQFAHDDLQAILTHVLDIETGTEILLRVSAGRISNWGDRIVGFDGRGRDLQLCVAQMTGGPCVPIGTPYQSPHPDHNAGLQWSPDDHYILVQRMGIDALILDPDGRSIEQPAWLEDGGQSWQRTR
jgi:hypothetical protein